ncbi:hypothetical protein F2P81_018929 [Scophthalmus maximus]|uniref:Uncharacterized protein n=1 Tax=Scophthalmus maximus TaxID=52904 RepID=A0A6A4SFY3_SCOMX|nr:hypothetical protein F2P81_018929 [Scophthalmus maximus]
MEVVCVSALIRTHRISGSLNVAYSSTTQRDYSPDYRHHIYERDVAECIDSCCCFFFSPRPFMYKTQMR